MHLTERGLRCLSFTRALFVCHLLMQAGVPPQRYGSSSQLSLEMERGGLSLSQEAGSIEQLQGFDDHRKMFRQEEKSKFKGGNMCVGSSKWLGLGEYT